MGLEEIYCVCQHQFWRHNKRLGNCRYCECERFTDVELQKRLHEHRKKARTLRYHYRKSLSRCGLCGNPNNTLFANCEDCRKIVAAATKRYYNKRKVS